MNYSFLPLFLTSLTFILPLGALPAMELQPGDSFERVKEVLGRPNGVISLKNKQVLFFDRGEVTLVDGKATKLDLLTEKEAEADLVKKQQKREKAAQLVEKRIQIRVKEGIALREDKLTSPDFLASSAGVRLDFWRNFRRRYPEVDITNALTKALNERTTELQRQAENQRLAQLESRVQDAEYRAEKAQRLAYNHNNPFYNFTDPHLYFGLPTRSRYSRYGRSSYYHRQRSHSSAVYSRINSLDSGNFSNFHGGHFQRRQVPQTVRFPTFFAPDLNR